MVEPPGLGERGSAIYQAKAAGVVDPAALALLLEAARCADRLDELDNIIQGKGVLNLMQFRVHAIEDDGADRNINVEVKFAAPLAEARQQQSTFSALVRAIDGFGAVAAAATPAAKQKSPTDELAARRAARKKREA